MFEVVHKASEHGLLRTICHRVPRITPFDAVSVSLNFGSSVHSRFSQKAGFCGDIVIEVDYHSPD